MLRDLQPSWDDAVIPPALGASAEHGASHYEVIVPGICNKLHIRGVDAISSKLISIGLLTNFVSAQK